MGCKSSVAGANGVAESVADETRIQAAITPSSGRPVERSQGIQLPLCIAQTVPEVCPGDKGVKALESEEGDQEWRGGAEMREGKVGTRVWSVLVARTWDLSALTPH